MTSILDVGNGSQQLYLYVLMAIFFFFVFMRIFKDFIKVLIFVTVLLLAFYYFTKTGVFVDLFGVVN